MGSLKNVIPEQINSASPFDIQVQWAGIYIHWVLDTQNFI